MTTENTKMTEQPITSCPRCNYELKLGQPVFAEPLKQAFARSVLNGVAFEHSFGLDLEGSPVVRMREPTCRETRAADHALAILRTVKAEISLHNKLALLLRLRSFAGKSTEFPTDTLLVCKTAAEVEECIETNLERMLATDVQQEISLQILRVFQTIVSALSELCLGQNFWKGAGLGA
jgi:tRNA G26 N,N-dimethylase Trm1